ncbi:hypothetical protein XM38_021910 [Halomicronema hongdechloris C2206]|uniref:Uncharacterized protein n=1 Tax=Halomicronema hongdechloris C2206 TaxID=1641165 RepID=A0A1Z3HLP0_9CYAN|nr:sigma-70 family RNA polymerase sigma factor [Halomicronema hongdechloris]ASC71239.1 hypothetical protein XM38_021910 [Halomicronema hongdechloris C2206]
MDQPHKQLELLNQVIRGALSLEEGSTSKKLIFFIRRSLAQMGLQGEWQESEVLIEAYLRTRERVMAGEVISNFPGYLAQVSQYILLEKRRQRQRNHNINQKLFRSGSDVVSSPESSYGEGISQETVSSLWSSFHALAERDQQVLMLRIVKGHSWKEIGYFMVEEGLEANYTSALVAKLRKQGERALDRLRKRMLSVDNS